MASTVSMQILSAVQSGHRPAIPDSAPQCIVQLLQKCWRMKSLERLNISEISQQLEGHLEVITFDKENGLANQDTHTDECFDVPSTSSLVSDDKLNSTENGLANQDVPTKQTDECFDVPSTSSSDKFSSVIDDNPNSPENNKFYLEIDASLGSSQKSLMSKQNFPQAFDHADTSHFYIYASRDGLDLYISTDTSKGVMVYSTNYQPVVDTQLLHSNFFAATENEINDNRSTHDHEHNVDMQKVKDVLKITEFKQFQIECAAAIKHGQDAIVVQPTGCGKSLFRYSWTLLSR